MACTMLRNKVAFGTASKQAVAPRMVRLVVRAQAPQAPKVQLPQLLKPAVAAAIANVIMALPASAEAGKLFDFNATLPIMAGEFLLLMVFLDKAWFTPVGKVLDERDAFIREKLASVKGDSSGVDSMIAEAESVLRAARSEVGSMIGAKKGSKVAELEKEYASAKAKVTAEVESSIAAMEREGAATLKKLDSSVEKIAAEVLRRVLPEGVKV